jgi:hypothetical protein
VTDDHLTLDEIAELDEGLLPPERISAARAHLHGCDQCRARADAISATRSMLAELPPVFMPDDVKARLDRALAEAAPRPDAVVTPIVAESSDVPGSDGDEPVDLDDDDSRGVTERSTTVMPNVRELPRRRANFGRPTMASGAAAAAVVLALGAIVVGHYHHGHHTTTNFDAGGLATTPANGQSVIASRPPSSSFTKSSTDQTYTQTNLAALVPGLLANTKAPVPTAPKSFGATTNRASGSGTSPSVSGGANVGAAGGGSGGSNASGGTTSAGSAAGQKSTSGSSPTGASSTTGGTASHGHPTNGSANPPLAPETLQVPTPTPSEQSLTDQPVPKALRALSRSRTRLLNCAATITDQPGAVPLAIDFARWTNGQYHRAPVVVFVFAGKAAGTAAVFIVAPACDGNSLLDYSQVPLSS